MERMTSCAHGAALCIYVAYTYLVNDTIRLTTRIVLSRIQHSSVVSIQFIIMQILTTGFAGWRETNPCVKYN